MSVTCRQIQTGQQRVDVTGLLPNALATMTDAEIRQLTVQLGNRRMPLTEVFDVSIEQDGEPQLTLITADDRIDGIGADLQAGNINVTGDTGDYVGRGMTGGTITVSGNVGDCAACGMRSGHIEIAGNVGALLAAPSAGERRGQQGGFIHVRGDVGDRAGERMRRGILLIEGNTGSLLGHRMIAGTIYVNGTTGRLAGYGMRRGSLLLRQRPDSLGSTIVDNGQQDLSFLPLLIDDLAQLSGNDRTWFSQSSVAHRFVGDLARSGCGEILVLP